MVQNANAALTYEGIYAQSNALLTTRQSLPDAVYASSSITGVSLNLIWNSLEPQKGVYDWSTLDAEVYRALAAGKQLSLTVTPNRPDSPHWLFTEGAQAYTFTASQHGTVRPQTIQIAAPWDPVYQAEYADMIQAMAQHLKQIPGAYEAVSVMKITGIGEITGELKLPVGNSTWQAAGYTPDKAIAAWTGFANAVDNAFPDKILGIAACNANAFPMIDNQGQIISSTNPTYVDVTSAIVSAGIGMFQGRFMVQWCGLGTGHLSPIVTMAGAQGAVEAYQTNHNLPSGMGIGAFGSSTIPTDATYAAVLEQAVNTGHVHYLEVWAADALQYVQAMDEVSTVIDNPQTNEVYLTPDLTIPNQGAMALHSTSVTVSKALTNGGDLLLDNSTVVAHGEVLNRGNIIADGADALFKANAPGTAGAVVNSGELDAVNGAHVHLLDNLNNQSGATVYAGARGHVDIDGAVANNGTMEAQQGGRLTIHGAVDNGGSVVADNAMVFVQSISGSGQALIQRGGTIEFGGSASGHVAFDAGAHGTLVIDQTATFKADVAGFGSNDRLDLTDLTFAGTNLLYVPDSSNPHYAPGSDLHSGVLRVMNSANQIVAKIKFVGDYTTANFTASDDGHGHLLVQHQDLLV